MKGPRPYLCEGLDRTGRLVRCTLRASGYGDAKTRFFNLHGTQATHITKQ
jgi:hypothetical protein